MDAAVGARIEVGGEAVEESDVRLLRAIDREGSLNAAAGALGRSYSRAQKRVSALEDAAGPLVERERGGAGGGGSRLTEAGRELVARFDRLQAALAGTAHAAETVLRGETDGASSGVVAVETAAGPVRALLSEPASRVQVSVRADAVTLHDPADAPGDDATSARNRFEGTVTAVESTDGAVTVTVDVGADRPLLALVTEGSRERLGLSPGRSVVASFKATATHATPADDA
ncbi:MAG: molybdenum-dependent transcriptional regulator [Haloarculaceae archaeon]